MRKEGHSTAPTPKIECSLAAQRCFANCAENRSAHTHRTGNPVLLPGLSHGGVPCITDCVR